MSKSYLINQTGRVQQWVADQCGLSTLWDRPQTLAVIENDELLSAVVYEGFRDCWCYMHFAIKSGYSLRRQDIRHAFTVPFKAMGLRKIVSPIIEDNTRSIDINKRLGLELEGILSDATPDGKSVLLYAMNRDKCRWIK